MGMFDNLHCDYPLPKRGANALRYQTKSLWCDMATYRIREDGTLWQEEPGREDDAFVPMWMADFDGAINFYNYSGDFYLEWLAVLIDGRVVKVKRVEDGR